MASFNKVIILGRCTRDPEVRSFANGGKVCKLGIAVDADRKKNQATGKWEAEPCFLDCEIFNRGENGKSADIAEQYLKKGSPVLIEGMLTQQNWTAADGAKRSKLVIKVDNFQLAGSKPTEGGERRQEPHYAESSSVDEALPF